MRVGELMEPFPEWLAYAGVALGPLAVLASLASQRLRPGSVDVRQPAQAPLALLSLTAALVVGTWTLVEGLRALAVAEPGDLTPVLKLTARVGAVFERGAVVTAALLVALGLRAWRGARAPGRAALPPPRTGEKVRVALFALTAVGSAALWALGLRVLSTISLVADVARKEEAQATFGATSLGEVSASLATQIVTVAAGAGVVSLLAVVLGLLGTLASRKSAAQA